MENSRRETKKKKCQLRDSLAPDCPEWCTETDWSNNRKNPLFKRLKQREIGCGGQKEIAKLLIANGADVNTKNKDSTTPLHQASLGGRKEVVELLIANGADVNAKVVSGTKQGLTPLDAANETNHPEIADLLRKHGGKSGKR